ncbi:MAG: TetR/AcrR family transcriptional regulator [Actinobacteria bacterium]|nr:TetR/AcrR family transcriptional regulator [Actinomycetota bacterium]
MRQTKTDRRSLRTRQLLVQAVFDLIRVKRYDAITVQEITDRANVGRSTFYAHFTDKDDLLVDGVRQLIAGLDGTAPAGRGAWLYPTLALFHHIGAQADMYKVLARGRGLALFMTALHAELTAVFTERLTARVRPDRTPVVAAPLLAAMTTSMLVTAIRTWIEGGLTEPAEAVDRAFHIAAEAAIRAGLSAE